MTKNTKAVYTLNSAMKIWLILALIVTWLPFVFNLPVVLHFLIVSIIVCQSFVFYKKIVLAAWIRFVFILSVLIVAGLFSLLHYSVEGVISFSLLAVFFKIFEIKSKKDIYVLLMSLLFVNSTACILNQSLFYSVWLIVNMSILLSVFVAIEHHQAMSFHKIIGFTVKQMLICIPLMLIVFLMFPRINAFWSMPGLSDQATTGLSDSLSPGSIANLAQSNAAAFRVTFTDKNKKPISLQQQPKLSDLYWRAMTLDYFDGKTWSQNDQFSEIKWQKPKVEMADSRYYQIIMQPSFQRLMLILDRLSTNIKQSTLMQDQTVLANVEFEKIKKYDVVSSRQFFDQVVITDLQLELLTQLPDSINPKTYQFSQTLMQDSQSVIDYIQKVLDHFKTNQFYYTLSPPTLNTKNQIDEFLFESKEGFCSHYASAFTVLMRMQNIPSRIVGGYLGGEYNDLGGFWQINQKQAHAWVEVYINGTWIRIDPTASVALTRIEQGMDSMFEANGLVEIIARSSWMSAFQKRMDAMNYAWQNKVLNYSANKQSKLVQNVGSWWNQNFKQVLLSILIISVLIFIGWALRMPIRYLFLPLHTKWVKKLDKRLGQVKPNQSMEDKLILFVKANPNKKEQAEAFLTIYLSWRFAVNSNIQMTQLKQKFKQLIST